MISAAAISPSLRRSRSRSRGGAINRDACRIILVGIYRQRSAAVVTIDRDRSAVVGLPIREVTDALARFSGVASMNDFGFNNRAYRVYVQGDQQFRAQPADLSQYYARASNGRHGAASAVMHHERNDSAGGPSIISTCSARRNLTGSALPGELGPGAAGDGAHRARDAAAMLRLRVGGHVARRNKNRAARPCICFLRCRLCSYLVLAAQ